tara:strand:- start:1647 stop:1964 length:318 start_codon:yes stop_codon:yes gene_type:complete
MSTAPLDEERLADASRKEILTALFERLVMQQTNMALMLLGKIPNPETKQNICDLEGAKLFVDQLEMLVAKTKGNLSDGEDALLRKSLAAARSALVETLEAEAEKD